MRTTKRTGLRAIGLFLFLLTLSCQTAPPPPPPPTPPPPPPPPPPVSDTASSYSTMCVTPAVDVCTVDAPMSVGSECSCMVGDERKTGSIVAE